MPSTPSPSPNPSTPPQPNPSPTTTDTETLYQIFTHTHPPTHLPNGTMTELSFAKTFLSTLDARPLKLQPDYTANPKTLSVNGPYTLPKMASAFKRPNNNNNNNNNNTSASPSSDPTGSQEQANKANVNVTLKSSKNPVLNLNLPGTETGATILELKEKVAQELKLGGTEKIRVLYHKKPVGDVKTLKELLAGNDDEARGQQQQVELGVMVMGYKEVAGDATMRDADGGTSVEQGGPSSGEEEVLGKEEFWADLRGFLMQRIRDEGKAGEVFGRFRESWEKR